MLADTKQGNKAEAARLTGLAKERERLQLGVGESFKANLNEPAMCVEGYARSRPRHARCR